MKLNKILCTFIASFIMLFALSCATPQATNASYVTMVNVDASDLILGDVIRAEGKFSNDELASGYAEEVLTAKALKDTNYDFIFMPRLEKVRSRVTLVGRPARLK